MNAKTVYFPGLNGLRALAAIAVVISHTSQNLPSFGLNPINFGKYADGTSKGFQLAPYSVTIFFVLSGFLITYLLQVEKDRQVINIKKFYLRRILRIWPLYYLYLIISVIVIIILGLDLNLKSLFLYIFYAANIPYIFNTVLPYLDHYWSLGVEEQFYLFWPWINKKSNSILSVITILIIVFVGCKVIFHLFYPNSLLYIIIHVTRFHCMMIGALGALLYKRKQLLFLPFVDNKMTQIICWFIIFLVAINKYHIISFLDHEIISFVALFLIIGQIGIKNRIINLEVNTLDFLGKISYGIYVIHPLVILL